MTNKAFIHIDESGNLEIRDGLVFYPQKDFLAVCCDSATYPHHVTITGCGLYNQIPKRWDLLGWLRMRRIILRWIKA